MKKEQKRNVRERGKKEVKKGIEGSGENRESQIRTRREERREGKSEKRIERE